MYFKSQTSNPKKTKVRLNKSRLSIRRRDTRQYSTTREGGAENLQDLSETAGLPKYLISGARLFLFDSMQAGEGGYRDYSLVRYVEFRLKAVRYNDARLEQARISSLNSKEDTDAQKVCERCRCCRSGRKHLTVRMRKRFRERRRSDIRAYRSGVAAAGQPLSGTVTLRDSSATQVSQMTIADEPESSAST